MRGAPDERAPRQLRRGHAAGGEVRQTVAHRGRRNADDALLAALAGGATVREAATTAGVGERTAWRRLDEEDFRRRLDEARRQTVRAAVDTLTRASTAAAATLATLLRQEYPPAVRLGAARSILELGGRLRESQDVLARIEALEAASAVTARNRGTGWRASRSA